MAATGLAALLMLAACDNQAISQLEEGVSTETDVRARFGEPENVWDVPNGRVLEFNRQPQGQKNYMITIGADGKMSALRQVLTPENFARVQPGMAMEDLRKLLGKPAKVTPYRLKNETEWDWRWVQPPNSPMVFTAVLN
ncbi:MAG: outer membrane protein assembly factor BamE, partial [Comamonadaceae bacterium]